MSIAFSLLTITFLGFITYEDFRYRAITWFVFPLAATVIIADNIYSETMVLVDIFLNVFYIAVQLIIITVYLSIKNKRFVRIWTGYLGAGDILFFLILCLFFSPVNFVLFYLGSLVITVIVVVVMRKFHSSFSLIPLAGIQSALLAILIIIGLFQNSVNYKVDAGFIGVF